MIPNSRLYNSCSWYCTLNTVYVYLNSLLNCVYVYYHLKTSMKPSGIIFQNTYKGNCFVNYDSKKRSHPIVFKEIGLSNIISLFSVLSPG